MRRFGRALGRGLLGLVILIAAAFLLAPREPVDLTPRFDAASLPGDLDAYLAASEARFDDIVPGTEKRILWAGAPGARTEIAIIYLHGFSATSEEIRPVPDRVAAALGANLYFARLAGHGRTPAAMAEPMVQDWIRDLSEALAIGRRIGRRSYVIATSTGGTLIVEAANIPELAAQIDGIALISPNFGLRHWAAGVLTWPMVRHWGRWVAGTEQCFEPVNAEQARYWTECYPTEAVYPMAALARHAARADYSGATTPALVFYSPEDRVVDPDLTLGVVARWGGEVVLEPVTLGAGEDPYRHVLAGNVLSPGQTARVAERIVAWIGELSDGG